MRQHMARNSWTISPLLLATAEVDRSQGLLYRDIGVKIESGVLAFLLDNGENKVLVDSGVCGVMETSQFLRYFNRTTEQTLEHQLAGFETSPDEISMIINTHLHIDHCAGNILCTKARWVVQKKEMEYWKNPLRVHRQAYRIELTETYFDLIDGDAEVLPGIRVMLSPGHSPGSQSVLVETSEGLYVMAGDSIPHFANMNVRDDEPFWPNGIYTNLHEYYETLYRLKELKGVMLPGHDLQVLKQRTYP
jgi:N-acyl homoserine lactone hydrolase